jgi:hypothetical protein
MSDKLTTLPVYDDPLDDGHRTAHRGRPRQPGYVALPRPLWDLADRVVINVAPPALRPCRRCSGGTRPRRRRSPPCTTPRAIRWTCPRSGWAWAGAPRFCRSSARPASNFCRCWRRSPRPRCRRSPPCTKRRLTRPARRGEEIAAAARLGGGAAILRAVVSPVRTWRAVADSWYGGRRRD